MTTTDTTRPDLSGLSREDRINIAVAGVLGKAWGAATSPGSGLGRIPDARYANPNYGLPSYTTDPAAWGALMEKEQVWVRPHKFGGGWTGYVTGIARVVGASPGEAVALAVLAKYGVEVGP